jgi:tetratricopeptide (TPR) repeat protein
MGQGRKVLPLFFEPQYPALTSSSSARRSGILSDWLLGLLLALTVLVAYAPVMSAGYIWDDDEYVVENGNLRDADGLRRIWLKPRSSPQYYPLVFTSFWMERQIAGENPAVGHTVNILLHIGNALLLWRILRRLGIRAGYGAALIFAVHPVHVESVAWLTERKNVLSGLFVLLSLLGYLRATQPTNADPPFGSRPAGRWYAVSLGLFVAALLSKSVTAMLAPVLLVLMWWKRDRIRRADVLPVLPYVLLGLVSGALTIWLELFHVGAAGVDWALSPLDRILVAGRALWFYVGKLLWPHPIVFIYPRWDVDPSIAWQWSFPVAALMVAAVLWRTRNRIGKGALTAVLAFAIMLFPVLGFLNVYPMRYSFVADHFQYLASIAIITALVALGERQLARVGLHRWRAILVLLVVVALVPVTRAEGSKYKNLEALWRDTIDKHPESWTAHNNLGILQLAEGRDGEARNSFQRALDARPDFAVAHNNLGIAWFRDGHGEEALEHHRRAAALDPGYAEAHNNVGVDLMSMGRLDEAIDSFRRALDVNPAYVMAHYNIARALTRTSAHAEADTHYLEAIRLSPESVEPRYDLALSRLAQGQLTEAASDLDTVLRLDPAFYLASYQLGNIRLRQGDAANAAVHYTRALDVRPAYAEAHANRGSAFLNLGRLDDAIDDYREALRLKPDYALAANNLGYALEQAGRPDEARRWYAEALRLDPSNTTARENLRLKKPR